MASLSTIGMTLLNNFFTSEAFPKPKRIRIALLSSALNVTGACIIYFVFIPSRCVLILLSHFSCFWLSQGYTRSPLLFSEEVDTDCALKNTDNNPQKQWYFIVNYGVRC